MIDDKKANAGDKPKRGRPTKWKDDMPSKLLESMEQGLSFEACCGELGITKDTGYRWVKDFPEFGAAKELGEVKGQLFWEKAVISGMWSSKDSEKFNTTAFIFIMKNRFAWRDRKEISGSLGINGGLDDAYKGKGVAEIEAEIAMIMARLPKPEGPKRS